MQYRNNRKGEPVSLLGYGCMRFTRKAGRIDVAKAEKEVLQAVDAGVNYFDTAYIYPGSEAALGEIVEKNNLRHKISIATKLPQYMVKSLSQVDKMFEEECRRLRTNYIDYYLMHMIADVSAWQRLENLGIREWIQEKIASGRIRNIGFSFHGNTEEFIKILDAYNWDFCMIQYNYVDEHSQAGRRGLKAANEKGIPVMIMEPLRGGKLVELLPAEAKKLINEYDIKRSPAEWALRWVMEQPEVTCVLSGMNSMEMLEENIRIADSVRIGEFGEAEQALMNRVKDVINSKIKVNCTACRYCMPCPGHIDIPGTFRCYNAMYTENRAAGKHEFLQTIAFQKAERKCINCGKCEQHCPQHLEVRKELEKADKELLTWYYRIGLKILRLFNRFIAK